MHEYMILYPLQLEISDIKISCNTKYIVLILKFQHRYNIITSQLPLALYLLNEKNTAYLGIINLRYKVNTNPAFVRMRTSLKEKISFLPLSC